MTSYSSSPYCRRTYGAITRPVPCSALSVPPRARTASTRSSVNAAYRSGCPPAVEPLGEHEVQVAVLGVAEDDAALVPVPVEQPGEVGAQVREVRHRHRDVLQQGGGPGRARAGDGGVQALADVPQGRASGRVGAQPRRARRSAGRRTPAGGVGGRGEPVGVGLLPLHEQRRVRPDGHRAQGRVGGRVGLGDAQRLGVEQLDRGGGGVDERRQRRHRVVQRLEHHQPGGRQRVHRHRPERRLGDECQRPLAAHDQRGEQPGGGVVVEEGVESVAHRVLHRELPPQRRDRDGVAADPVPQALEPDHQLAARGSAAGCRRRPRRCRRRSRWAGPGPPTPGWRTSWPGCRRSCPEELLATTPPTVQADSLAGSGPSLRPYRPRRRFTWRRVTPGWTRTRAPSSSTSTSRKCRRVSTRTPDVPACPDRLVPPERNVSAAPSRRAVASSAATCVGAVGHDDGLRGQQVVRRVVGVRRAGRWRATATAPGRACSRAASSSGSGASEPGDDRQCDSRDTRSPLEPTRKSRSAPVSACSTWSTYSRSHPRVGAA